MINDFNGLFLEAGKRGRKKVILAAANDYSALSALVEAKKEGLAEPILVGDKKQINELLEAEMSQSPNDYEIISASDKKKAAKIASSIAGKGEADIILKGNVTSSGLLKAVLDDESHLKSNSLLSDVVLFEDPRPHKKRMIMLTDGGVNISPSLEQKAQIIRNAVKVAHAIGNKNPKVAVLSAAEYEIQSMQSTVDAVKLREMNRKGKIEGCIVDGPFAIDNAVSEKDAAKKGIVSPVAGKADILIAPSIEAGNIFAKGLVYFAGVMIIHVIVGAKIPVLICSRVDPPRAKLTSIALAIAIL